MDTWVNPICQYTTNPAPIPANTSGRCMFIQGTRTLLGLTIGLDGGRFQIHFNSYPTPIQYHHWKISLHSTIWYVHIGYTLAQFMPTYHNTNRQMCLYHQVKSTQPQTLVSMKDDLANKNNPPNHHYSSCPMSIWHQSNPNTGQCKWPMCSYTGNKFSTGTHHWSGRSMIWQTKRKPLPTPAHPIQQTQSITFPPAQCQPPISNANPSILYQYANPMPINSQYIWPFRSYTGNKLSTGTQLMVSTEDDFNRQCFINQSTLPIQCQYNANTTRQMYSYLLEQVSMRQTISLSGGWFQQTMFHKSEHDANPMSMHLANVRIGEGTSICAEDY